MPKYIVYKNTVFGEKYLTHVINKRPYSSSNRAMAQVCENRELAEFVAKQAYTYSGDNWKVRVVEDE